MAIMKDWADNENRKIAHNLLLHTQTDGEIVLMLQNMLYQVADGQSVDEVTASIDCGSYKDFPLQGFLDNRCEDYTFDEMCEFIKEKYETPAQAVSF